MISIVGVLVRKWLISIDGMLMCMVFWWVLVSDRFIGIKL